MFPALGKLTRVTTESRINFLDMCFILFNSVYRDSVHTFHSVVVDLDETRQWAMGKRDEKELTRAAPRDLEN